MATFHERLEQDIERFKERVFTDPVKVLDPEGEYHHEFSSGKHGRKLDFDLIETGSDFYLEWIGVYARALRALYAGRMPDALVGIANGANRLATSIAPMLGEGVLGLTTDKVDRKTVKLSDESIDAIRNNDALFVVTVEDVGTTGGTTSSALGHLREIGVPRIESVNGWQRNASLPVLEEMRVPHHAVVNHPLPTYSVQECATVTGGYCADQIPLIEHQT